MVQMLNRSNTTWSSQLLQSPSPRSMAWIELHPTEARRTFGSGRYTYLIDLLGVAVQPRPGIPHKATVIRAVLSSEINVQRSRQDHWFQRYGRLADGESVQHYLTGGAPPDSIFSLGNKIPRLVSIHAESTGVTDVFGVRPVLEGSGRDADPCQRQLLGPSVLAKNDCSSPHRRPAPSPACFEHASLLPI